MTICGTLLENIESTSLCSCVLEKGSSLGGSKTPCLGQTHLSPGLLATWESAPLGLKVTIEMDGAETLRIWWKQNDGRDLEIYNSYHPAEQKAKVMRELELNAAEFEECLGI